MTSILSERPDGLGMYYGFAPGDSRQINVRFEIIDRLGGPTARAWVYYVGGKEIGAELSKGEAEAAAIRWAKQHPEA